MTSRPAKDPEHDERVRAAIQTAYEKVPFYKKKRPKPPSWDAKLSDLLQSIPLLYKSDIRATLPKEWVPEGRDVKAELADGRLELVETSGSTAERTRILWDKGWWLAQEERGMRTNDLVDRAMSDPSYKEAILTTPVCGLGVCHTGEMPFEERLDEFRLFLNGRADPTYWKPKDMSRMLDELARHETRGLETDPTYLAALARFAKREGRKLEVKDFITLTYAMTSRAHVRAAEEVTTGARIFQLYGASEVGVLFMEGTDGLLHHCPRTTHVELLPVKVETPGSRDVALVVVTTLDRSAEPLVRFVVGDLVSVEEDGPRRFTPVAPIRGVEGRVQDTIVRPDGAWVTAAALDRAISGVADVAFYQANQSDAKSVTLDVVVDADGGERAVGDAVKGLLAGLDVDVRRVTAVAAEPSGKFRLVRRHFPADLGVAVPSARGVQI